MALCALLLAVLALAGAPHVAAQTAAYFSGAYTGIDASGLSNPEAVAVDAHGRVFTVDSGNSRLVMDTPNGSGGYTQSVILSNATAPGGLNSLRDVAVDPQGNVYALDQNNQRVLELTLNGDGATFSAPVAICTASSCGLNDPTGIAVDKYSNLYIIDPGTDDVTVRPAGTTNAHNKSFYLNTGQWNSSTIAVDQNLNVWVNDTQSGYDQIIEFVYGGTSNDGGAKIGTYPSLNRLGNCFGPSGPQHIAVDAAQNIYVADPSSNQIVKWIPTGTNAWTSTQFLYPLSGPWGVALDLSGNLFIADGGNNRVLEATSAYLSGQAGPTSALSARSPWDQPAARHSRRTTPSPAAD